MTVALSFVLCHLSFSEAQAQLRFGLKGGFLLSNMEFSSDALDSSNRAGFYAGPTLKIGLPVTGMEIGTSVLYERRDLKVEDKDFRQQSLLLQGDFRCGAGLGDVLGIFILVGPQFSFNVGDDLIQWATEKGDNNQFSLQETMLSVNFGAGVSFANHFEGFLRYNVPVSKTADFTWNKLSDQLLDQTWHHAKTRTNSWSVSLTYYF